ncbi:TPA: phosphatase PAP2 family protein [Legionella anisa]
MRISVSEKYYALLLGVILVPFFLIFYTLIGHNSSLGDLNYSSYIETFFDRQIPFVPVFICFYLFTIVYPIVGIVYLLKKTDISTQTFYRIYISALIMIAICASIWVTFPIKFTLRITNPELATYGFWGNIVAINYYYTTSWNACPSFHIAISWFILRVMRFYLGNNVWFFQFLFCAIAASTLLIRIHYIADIVFGILISEFCSNVILRYMEKIQLFNNFSRKGFIYSYLGILGALVIIFLG